MNWQVGVTTVPQRFKLLEQTVDSLMVAGWGDPLVNYDSHQLGILGNWICTAWSLYTKNPHADRYAIFQDDVLCREGLKQYLDQWEDPDRGYWNLYLTPQTLVTDQEGFYKTPPNQRGRGACGLVFSNEVMQLVLRLRHLVLRPRRPRNGENDTRNTRNIDGVISDGLHEQGISEYVHNPQLVYHAGNGDSTVGHAAFEQSGTWTPGAL